MSGWRAVSSGAARRTAAVSRKELRHTVRDPLSLGLLVALPALLLVLYGYALSFDVKHVPMAVLDLDRTPASRSLLEGVFENPYFDRVATIHAMDEADRLLSEGRVRAVLTVPVGYARALARGQEARVQVLVDGADANTAGAAVGYLDAMAVRLSRAYADQTRSRTAPPLPSVRSEPRVWFNPGLESARFLVPGLVAMLLMISAVIATSLSIVREKEHETIDQMMASPLRPVEFIVGKTLPYVCTCLATMAMILLLGYLLFGVVVTGSFAALAVATIAFLFAALGMGVLVSSVTRSQQVAFQIAIMSSLLPSILLSGFIFPIKNMPVAIQAVTHVVVARYFVSALRDVVLRGASVALVWRDVWPMLLLGLVFNALALVNTRKAV